MFFSYNYNKKGCVMADKYLTDKDIEKLKLKQGIQKYEEVIGEPKELYLYVYESGKKTFFIKLSLKK